MSAKRGIPVLIWVLIAACGLWALFLVAVFGYGFYQGFRNASARHASSPRAATPAPISGEACGVRMPGSNERVPLFENESDFLAWSAARARSDERAADAAFGASGFTVMAHTGCVVLEKRATHSRVQLTEGPSSGRAGWLRSEWH